MMGEEWVSVPSLADHLMLWPVAGAKESGRPRSGETMLRDQGWPHCGWSAAERGRVRRPKAKTRGRPKSEGRNPKEIRRPKSEEMNCRTATAKYAKYADS